MSRPWRSTITRPSSVRPIRPEDEPLLVKFHQKLSDDTVYNRYSQMLKLSQRVAHERLSRICFIDYEREMALIAERNTSGEQPEIIGVVRLIKVPGTDHAELALVISDRFQRRGLGTRLAQCAVDVARSEKMRRLIAYMLPANRGMQRVCEKLGFQAYVRERPGDRAFGSVSRIARSRQRRTGLANTPTWPAKSQHRRRRRPSTPA